MPLSVARSLAALALAVASLNLAAGQAQPSIAIVGARIIDGSGNEPFVGNVVIDGGRIQAVGRSIEVPASAVKIEGEGRTLLPGLVDVAVALDDAASSRPAAALAAALYSGVTSVGAIGAPAERLDAIRAESGRPDAGPRVSGIGALPSAPASAEAAGAEWARVFRSSPNAILASADAPGVEATAADARSRGLRVIVESSARSDAGRILALEPHVLIGSAGAGDAAALVQRNITVAPDLLGVAPVAVVALDKIATELSPLRERVPAGVAWPNDDAAWKASSESVRALRDGRVRLAVASRAGSSRLLAGLSTHVAVRLLVEVGLSPLQAVTAATSGGAWALGLQSDRGFLAPGMRADLVLVQGDPTSNISDLGRVEHVFLGGVDVDRAALLAKTRVPEPSPATPEPEKTAEAKPTPPVKTTLPGRSRRGRRGAVPKTEVAPETPAALPATPSSAAPSSARVAPAEPAASTSEAPREAAVATPIPLGGALIDDFEHGESRSAAGPAWSSVSNEGGTPATIVMGRVVRGIRDHALHLTARMGDGPAPFVRASISLATDGRPVDISRFRGVRFDARGEGRYRIVFVTRAVADGRYHVSYFSGSPVWTPVGIPFASIGQNGAGSPASFTGRDLLEIRFEVARDPGQMAWLELDNVRFY